MDTTYKVGFKPGEGASPKRPSPLKLKRPHYSYPKFRGKIRIPKVKKNNV